MGGRREGGGGGGRDPLKVKEKGKKQSGMEKKREMHLMRKW